MGFFHQLEGVRQTPYTYSWEGQERVLAFCRLHAKNLTTFIQTRKNLTTVFLHKHTYILATDSYVKEKMLTFTMKSPCHKLTGLGRQQLFIDNRR